MKFRLLIGTVICCLSSLYTAAKAEPPVKPMSFNEYKQAVDQVDFKKHRLNLSEFKELCNKPGVYILDLREKWEYDEGHIKGALQLGADITEERLQQLIPDKNATIVMYCQELLSPLSRRMPLTYVGLPQTIALGYPNSFVLEPTIGSPVSLFGPLWETSKIYGGVNTPSERVSASPRPPTSQSTNVDFGPYMADLQRYMADLQRRIKRCWFPPKGYESKKVVVIFKIHRGGELSNLRLEHSSGVAAADQAALKAVENAAPLRPLSAGLPDAINIQFTFDYNAFSGGGSAVLLH